MELLEYLVLVIVGVIAGFLNVVAGGGSLLTLPTMIFMGLPPNVANATNRVAILWQNVFAIKKFKSAGVVDSRYSIYLGLAAVPGAILGAVLAVDIDGALFTKILSVIMLVVGFLIVFGSPSAKPKETSKAKEKSIFWGVVSFFLIGVYGGFIHAGVGFIIILVLTQLTQESLVRINSIKVIIAFIYTAAVVLVFIFNGVINWEYGITLAVGTSIGGWLGSYFSIKKGDKWIKAFLLITIIAMVIKLWFYH
ncbi:MAG: sulfite exporter TauE/SafE family protein [Cyclobacteriaceae bacterium]